MFVALPWALIADKTGNELPIHLAILSEPYDTNVLCFLISFQPYAYIAMPRTIIGRKQSIN